MRFKVFSWELDYHFAGASYANVLEGVIKIEEKIRKYYIDLAEVSKSLMADIPMAFERITKKRDKRKMEVESLK